MISQSSMSMNPLYYDHMHGGHLHDVHPQMAHHSMHEPYYRDYTSQPDIPQPMPYHHQHQHTIAGTNISKCFYANRK